jgi:hypothetical protein
MKRNNKHFLLTLVMLLALPSLGHARATENFPIVKLRSLDKITARTVTFEAKVGSTVKFGGIYIKVQACRKAPEIEKPESAAFLQVWDINKDNDANWIFSGWMFASSPGLSAMDHPIYDVWVLDCLQTHDNVTPEGEDVREGEGEVDEAPVPDKPAPSAPEETPETPASIDPAQEFGD